MWQTEHVIARLQEHFPEITFTIIPISTKGDKILDVPLAKIGDKGLFTKELEVALINGEIDFAVHSVKDMPTKLPEGLVLGAMTVRHNPQDALVAPGPMTFMELPKGAKVGTSSLRRRAQILHLRPDLELADIRGNVQTRLEKMHTENFDAIILAAAGLERLGLEAHIQERLDFSVCLPAVGQGSLAIEIRENDPEIAALVSVLNDEETALSIRAERALLRSFEGGCQIPIGAQGTIAGDLLVLEALVASLDGTKIVRNQLTAPKWDPEACGIALADQLRKEGAEEILREIRQGETV